MKRENSESNKFKFFAQIEELMCKFAEKGAGKVDINLQSQPIGKGQRKLKVYAPNLTPSLNVFSSVNLRSYLSQSYTHTDKKAFLLLKESLLDILNAGGFGKVQLIFSKNKKEETIIFCEVTISQKYVVS